MRYRWRGLAAIALVLGVVLLPVAALCLMISLDVFAAIAHPPQLTRIAATAPAIIVVGGALIAIIRVERRGDLAGYPLRRDEQPALYELVDAVARHAGATPPRRLVLTHRPTVALAERTAALGLLAGRPRLEIGLPLLLGLDEAQFAAVLAHEFGHRRRASRAVLSMVRGRTALRHGIRQLRAERFGDRVIAELLRSTAALHTRITAPLRRRQELLADEFAARVAGPGAAMGALRELPAIGVAWRYFVTAYVTPAWRVGLVPVGAVEAFRNLLDDPMRAAEFDGARFDPPRLPPTPECQPPEMDERIAVSESIETDPLLRVGGRPAVELLVGPGPLVDAALRAGLENPDRHAVRTSWQELLPAAARAEAVAAARPLLDSAANLTGTPATLGMVLDLLDADRAGDAGESVTESIEVTGTHPRLGMARPAVRNGLAALVVAALADTGVVRWDWSWSARTDLAIREPYRAFLPDLLDSAVVGETEGLRVLLDEARVNLADAQVAEPRSGSTPSRG